RTAVQTMFSVGQGNRIAKTLSSRRQDSNLCILKSALLNFGDLAELGTPETCSEGRLARTAIRGAQVKSCPAAKRLGKFRSKMQRFEPCRITRTESPLSNTPWSYRAAWGFIGRPARAALPRYPGRPLSYAAIGAAGGI